MGNNQKSLKRTMTERHVMMIALGGAIGSGIFKGSSSAINIAGPSVIIAYILGGIIMLFVMQGLAEMAVRGKNARTFRDLIEPILGPFAGYFVGWTYWIFWVFAMAAEAVAAASFLQFWLPNVPLWLLALIVSVAVTLLNLFSVKVFAEAEYWLAAIKIFVISLFIVFGFIILFIPFGEHHAAGFANLTAHDGFLPHGVLGILTAMFVVVFSYGGTEMIGVTLAEVQNPENVIPKAVRSTFIRILSFYVLPFLIMVSLIPWNQLNSSGQSPFVTVFQIMGIPFVSHFMNAVMLTAVISSLNTGMYSASRVLYTQALDDRAWKTFTRLTNNQVPINAILASTFALYIGVLVAFFAKGKTFDYLMTSLSYTILIIWFFISLAHIKSRKNVKQLTGYHVRLFPYTSWVSLIAIVTIFIGVLFSTPIAGTAITLGLYLVISIYYFFKKKNSTFSLIERTDPH
ncbi:amino acid permease [Neobacillus fumarioli]|uniref:amino acid permease n=1 Tax=Neobacillus fumarioli TaxID=105229 RepID=UPI000831AC99|nr:amino acid permease [Neobacillus fumarioli]